MISAYQLAIAAAGIFFMNALLTGVWKYLEIVRGEHAQAHPYVDIAHRASLMYSFAALLLATFVEISQMSDSVERLAVGLPLTYFAFAIVGYMVHGFRKKTDNQFRNAGPALSSFMWTLIAAYHCCLWGAASDLFPSARPRLSVRGLATRPRREKASQLRLRWGITAESTGEPQLRVLGNHS